MKLTYDDFKNRKSNVSPEDRITSLMDKILEDSVEEITRIIGKKPELRDIKEFLVANLLDFSKDIKGLKNTLFSYESQDIEYIWNVVIDNDVVLFDSYIIHMENKEVIEDFSYGIHLLDNGQCEVTLDVSEEIKNNESINLSVFELGIILRLLCYIILISDGHAN